MIQTTYFEIAAIPPINHAAGKLKWQMLNPIEEDAQWSSAGRFYRFESLYPGAETQYFVQSTEEQWDRLPLEMRFTGPHGVKLAKIRHFDTFTMLLHTDLDLYAPN